MKQVVFEDLANLPVVKYYETAFRKATGVSLKVVPLYNPEKQFSPGPSGNPFCSLVSRTPAGCEACLQDERRVQRRAAQKLSPQQIHCFAGLTVVAVPVVIGGRHVATLLSGQVLRREPTQRDFSAVVGTLGGGPNGAWKKRARRAYFETPVVTAGRFQAIVKLLNVFAQYLTDYASRCVIASSHEEPTAVTSAKEFIHSHIEEPVTLARVAQHVHVSPFYFCKLFKKATGMTLTEYVARVRVEKAKTLLVDPSLRISEVGVRGGLWIDPAFQQRVQAICRNTAHALPGRATIAPGDVSLPALAPAPLSRPPQSAIRECQAASSARAVSETN